MERNEILEIINEVANEGFNAEGAAPLTLTEKSDLLTDVPGVNAESLADFVIAVFNRIFAEPQDDLVHDMLDESPEFAEIYSDVAMLIDEVLSMIEEGADDLDVDGVLSGYGPEVGAEFLPPAEAAEREPYGLHGPEFDKYMGRLKGLAIQSLSPQARVLEYATGLNSTSLDLLKEFMSSEYFGGEEIDDTAILAELEMVVYWVHMILTEYDLKSCKPLADNNMEMEFDFSNPVEVRFYRDLHPAAQVLACLSGSILEAAIKHAVGQASKDQPRTPVPLEAVLADLNGVLSVAQELAEHCGKDVASLVKF